VNNSSQATPIATTPSLHLLPSFFARPAEQVAPELIGCLLVKRQADAELVWGVVVETEAYSQEEPACHGHRRRTPSTPLNPPPASRPCPSPILPPRNWRSCLAAALPVNGSPN